MKGKAVKIKYNRYLANVVWCLSKNRLDHFVFIQKNLQIFNSLTFPFLADTKLQFAHCLYPLGTSNWSQDYYTRTAGIGFVVESVSEEELDRDLNRPRRVASRVASAEDENSQDLRQKLVGVFKRDWNSPHCRFVEK